MQLTLAVTGTRYYLKWFIWVFQKTQAHFRLGVKAKVELKSFIPIGAITEISPKGFTLGALPQGLCTRSLAPRALH
jgi:hypothetical protein